MKLELFLSGRLFSENKKEKTLGRTSRFIAITSVAISIAVIVVAIVISKGFRHEIQNKCVGYSGDYWLTAVGTPLYNTEFPVSVGDKPLNELRNSGKVESVQPVVYTQGLLKVPDDVEGVILKGIDSTFNFSFLQKNLVDGELPLYNGAVTSNEIVISSNLGKLLNLGIGDKVEAYFIKDDIRVRRFTVCGIYSTGMSEMDKLVIYADLRHARKLNGWDKNQVSGYEIVLKEKFRGDDNNRIEFENILYNADSDDLSDSIILLSAKDLFYNLFDWLHLIDLNVLIILLLMIIVSGFNMVSGILILIFERISQIGLLKAIGMQNASIIRTFMISALKIIFKGLIIGNIVGILLCIIQQKYGLIKLDAANYFVDRVPVYFSWSWIIGVNVILIVAIAIILLMPLHFVQKVSPAKTLTVK